MAAAEPLLVASISNAQSLAGVAPASEVFVTIELGAAKAVSAAATGDGTPSGRRDWNQSVELLPPNEGADDEEWLAQLIAREVYITVDVHTKELVGSTHRGRLLLPAMQSVPLRGTFSVGPPPRGPGAAKPPRSGGFGSMEIVITPSLRFRESAAAAAMTDAVWPAELGQWSVQPSPGSGSATVSVPGDESCELVANGISACVSGVRRDVALRLTASQLLVIDAAERGGADLTMAVPRGCITDVSLREQSAAAAAETSLRITCKDFRVLTLSSTSTVAKAQLAALHSRLHQWTQQLGESRAALEPAAVEKWQATAAAAGEGWELDLSKEFDRQTGGGWAEAGFRDAGNDKFEICATYPQLVLLPQSVTADVATQCAEFRSKHRLPCLSWFSSSGCIYRCAQPMTGPLSTHSEADEALVGELRQVGEHGKLVIFDCRSHSAAAANSLKGAGLEDPSRYVNCQRVFLDIGNIHAMRHSLEKLVAMLVEDVQDFDDHEDQWLPQLNACGWLGHIRLLLGSALEVALVLRDGTHALVHCSDGWDRTSQICALAQLLVDPFFRTMSGFRVLVQKDFVAFGHMCRKRLGTVAHPHERSPVLLQFFEVVHHIREQCPSEFEFNDAFLVSLARMTDSELFGDFLCNSEKERVEGDLAGRAPSMWAHLCARANRDRYRSSSYKPTVGKAGGEIALLPVCPSLKYIHLWTELYCRYDESQYEKAELSAGRAVGQIAGEARRMSRSRSTLQLTKGEGEGVEVRVASAGHSLLGNDTLVAVGGPQHIEYTYELQVGKNAKERFDTRFSSALAAHEAVFAANESVMRLDPPLTFPSKHFFKDMIHDESNVKLRESELQVYYQRLLGEAALITSPEAHEAIGLSADASARLVHLLTDC